MKLSLLLVFSFFILTKAHALYGPLVLSANDNFVVSLHLRDPEHSERDFFCNGVLISPTKVLTAGHCIEQIGGAVYDKSLELVYRPELVSVKVNARMIQASEITLSPMYFESNGLAGEDLALIDLSSSVLDVKPLQIANRELIRNHQSVTLIARGKKVMGSILFQRKLNSISVLILGKEAGACLGDSGGAVVVEQNGQQMLAGILMYSGDVNCAKKPGYAYFPKLQF